MKKKKGWKLFLILLLLEIFFLGGWGIKISLDINQAQDKVRLVKEGIYKLQEENQRLKELKKNLADPFYIEKEAREKLGLAKRGEIVYKIISP
ncbi:septum formation initiator family protein [Patescibacteria group bacterium]|nr:septum formation initiator family protein [Patescibacteria group bacterium]